MEQGPNESIEDFHKRQKSIPDEKYSARKVELEKNNIAGRNRLAEHKMKIEREEQRHKNVMEEIAALSKAGIKIFVRGKAQYIEGKDLPKVK